MKQKPHQNQDLSLQALLAAAQQGQTMTSAPVEVHPSEALRALRLEGRLVKKHEMPVSLGQGEFGYLICETVALTGSFIQSSRLGDGFGEQTPVASLEVSGPVFEAERIESLSEEALPIIEFAPKKNEQGAMIPKLDENGHQLIKTCRANITQGKTATSGGQRELLIAGGPALGASGFITTRITKAGGGSIQVLRPQDQQPLLRAAIGLLTETKSSNRELFDAFLNFVAVAQTAQQRSEEESAAASSNTQESRRNAILERARQNQEPELTD